MTAPPPARRRNLRSVLVLAPWLLLLFGAWVRVVPWIWNRSLWLDEAYLGVNLRFRSFGGLLGTLDHDQAAPVGFLFAERALGLVFRWNERGLRLLPLVAGIASLFLVHSLARRILRGAARPLAMALAALSPLLVYYSSELKPYAVDLALTLLVLRLFVDLPAAVPSGRRWWGLLVTGAVASWFSFPVVFVLAGVGLTGMAAAWRRGDGAGLRRLVAASAVWAASFGVQYFVALRALRGNEFLRTYWQEFFLPSGEGAGAMAAWGGRTAADTFSSVTGNTMAVLAAVPFAAGVASLWNRRRWTLVLLLSPAAVAGTAAALHLYPVGERLALYLLPCLVLPVAEGCRALRWPGRGGAAAAVAILFLLLAVPTLQRVAVFTHRPILSQESRPLMEALAAEYRPGDFVYVHKGAEPAFRFYAPDFGLDRIPVRIGVRGRMDSTVHVADLEPLRGHRRVWALLTHTTWHDSPDERPLVIGLLDRMGVRRSHVQAKDADLLLYDMSRR